jgi:hypothetical protein
MAPLINPTAEGFIVASSFKPSDKKFMSRDDVYGYGSITFWHPLKFSLQSNLLTYEEAFIEFIERNLERFKQCGADEIEIFLEVYSDEDQLNFEVFNRDVLHKLLQYNISLPVCVYRISTEKLENWSDEVRKE